MSNKVAYITGASRGIGAEIARTFAQEGFDVGLLARSENDLRKVRDELADTEVHAEYAAVDLCDAHACAEALNTLKAKLGSAHVVVHNAGLVLRKSLEEVSTEEYESLLRLNLLAPIQITKALLPAMKIAQHGHIIFIASVAGKVPLPGGCIYAASKFGLRGFASSLLGEVRNDGIRVSTIYPGSVRRDHEDQSHAWKLSAKDIAAACLFAINQPQNSCVAEIEVRPLQTSTAN